MANSYGPKGIVTDGLVFNADPSNIQCYPGTGTEMLNSVQQNTGTINAATWERNCFDYDGNNDWIDFAQPNANLDAPIWSLEMWINPDNEHNGCLYMSRSLFDSGTNGCQILWRSTGDIAMRGGGTTYASFGDVNTGGEVAGKWTQIVVTMNGTTANLYLNGGQAAPNTNVTIEEIQVSTYPATIGCGTDGWSRAYDYSGKIGPVRAYHKILTTAEMLQNYNSQKSKFGL